MAEPASKLTERLLAAVNRERETRNWTIDEWRLRFGDEWTIESSRPLLELSACATEAASALEQAEKALRTLTSCQSGLWGGACPTCQLAAREALAALGGKET